MTDATTTRRDVWGTLGVPLSATFDWTEVEASGHPIALEVERIPLKNLLVLNTAEPDAYAAVRDGHVLYAGHGRSWRPWQAKQTYDFASEVIRMGGGEPKLVSVNDKAGAYFMTFDRGTYKIGDYDMQDYLTGVGSANGQWSLLLVDAATIIACANAIASLRRGHKHFTFKHTAGTPKRVELVLAALEKSKSTTNAFKALGNNLVRVPLGKREWQRLLDRLFPVIEGQSAKRNNANESAITAITGIISANELVDSAIATGFDYVQAVNTYENWGGTQRKVKGMSVAEARAQRQLNGTINGQKLTDAAIQQVLARV